MARISIVFPQWIGGIGCVGAALALTATSGYFAVRHSGQLTAIGEDRLSLAAFLGAIAALYALVICLRIAWEPQYARYVQGRAQEAAYRGNWKVFAKPFVPLVAVCVNVAVDGWHVPIGLFAWASFVWAVMGSIKELTGAWLRPVEREQYFFVEPSAARGVETRVHDLPRVADGDRIVPFGTRWLALPGRDWVLMEGSIVNRRINAALQDPQSALCRSALHFDRTPLWRRPRRYQLHSELAPYRETAFVHIRARGGLLYNEPKIRLVSDLEDVVDQQTGVIHVQRTSYFDYVCSNDVCRYIVAQRGPRAGQGTDLFSHVRSAQNGRIVTLGNSKLSNHLGGGTLAISSTGRLILSKQGRLTLAGTGKLAPAGSGSFDWADMRAAGTLRDLVVRGLERELREECRYERDAIVETMLLGYGRDLARGGKPDFYAVTLVNAEPPDIDRTEFGFIDEHEPHDLLADSVETLLTSLRDVQAKVSHRASEALRVNLQMLIEAEPDVLRRIVAFMDNAHAARAGNARTAG